MIAYRLAVEIFSRDLSGEGAKIYGGRWNQPGTAVVYTSESISLSMLELLARTSKQTSPDHLVLIFIEIPDNGLFTIELKKLKKGWQQDYEYTREIGTNFLKEQQTLCLKVPSAIVPQDNNFLINPHHKDFNKIKIIHSEPLELDKRLAAF